MIKSLAESKPNGIKIELGKGFFSWRFVSELSKAKYVGHMYVNHKKMKVKDLFSDLCKMTQIPSCELIVFEVRI